MDAYRLSIDIQPDILERILYLIYIVKCSENVHKMYVVNLEENTSGYIRSSKRSIRTLKQMEKSTKCILKMVNGISMNSEFLYNLRWNIPLIGEITSSENNLISFLLTHNY